VLCGRSIQGGGNFENGAVTGAFAILATEALIKASNYYKDQVGRRANALPGKNQANGKTQYDSQGQQRPVSWKENIIGLRKPHTPASSWYSPRNFFKEGGMLSRALNLVPGMNAVAGLHDYWLNPVTSPVKFNFFNNVGTMVPAAAVSTAAIFGNAMQGSTFSMRMQAVSQSIQINAILGEGNER